MVKALELFEKTGFPLDRVTLKFGHEGDIAHTILDEARTGGHGTIVISRQGSNGLKRFFGGGITDQLLREASGYTLWAMKCRGSNVPAGSCILGSSFLMRLIMPRLERDSAG